jgi:3-hydroxyisobutyrate dehydrogenase-like beta-hydroxyacid dehydrogenase
MGIGFIGFGEAAYEMAKGLKAEGFEKIAAYDPMMNHPTFSALVKERAKQAEVELFNSPEEVLKQFDVVIVSVPANQAKQVSESLEPHLRSGMIYVDVSASTPTTKKNIWSTIQSKGTYFVDAAMLGALTVYQHKVPMLVSGSGADRFIELMTPYGMNIEKTSDNPGDASAVKLTRSIFMKGIAALLIETLEAAHTLEIEDLIINSIKDSMGNENFDKVINQLVTGTAIHSARRSKEVEGSIEMLELLGINSFMSVAIRDKLSFVSDLNLKEQFQGKRPEHWIDVITACKAAINITNT